MLQEEARSISAMALVVTYVVLKFGFIFLDRLNIKRSSDKPYMPKAVPKK